MKKLIIPLLALTLVGCNKESKPDLYNTFELDQAVAYAASCIGTDKPTSYGFKAVLPAEQGMKVWGLYNWTTQQMTISAELDWKKHQLEDQATYENYLVTVVSHELAHRLQSKTYWTISPSYIPWADRPEEQNAQLLAGVCLSKFLNSGRSYETSTP